MRRRYYFMELLEGYYRYILVGVLFIVLVIILFSLSKKHGADTFDISESTSITSPVSESSNAISLTDESVKINAYPGINVLMKEYFSAMASGDVSTLKEICSRLDENAEKRVSAKAKYTESYDDIVCYTKPGPFPDSYIVLAKYNVKYINIDTLAPGISTLLVCENPNGDFYVFNDELEENAATYIKSVVTQEDVIDVLSKTDTEYSNAVSQNKSLKAFMDTLPARIDEDILNMSEAATKDNDAEGDDTTEIEVKVIKSDVRIRSEPDTSSNKNIIGTAAKDEVYMKLGEEDGWSKIKYKDTTGYIRSDMLSTVETSAADETDKKNVSDSYIEIVDNGVRVRSSPNIEKDNIIGAVNMGETYDLISEKEGWYQIEYKGLNGYIKADPGLAKAK